MNFAMLVFGYDLEELQSIGRAWAPNVYKGKEFIFEYSAASAASFLHHNPNTNLHVITDEPNLFMKEISQYSVDVSNLICENSQVELAAWKEEAKEKKYPFITALRFQEHVCNILEEPWVKLDNDLICKGSIDPITQWPGICIWKTEGHVAAGREIWGEREVARKTLNTEDFVRYNIGVLSYNDELLERVEDIIALTEKMIAVDISEITDVKSRIWHACEQTAVNWIIHESGLSVRETTDIFDHHFDNKSKCIEAMKWLRR